LTQLNARIFILIDEVWVFAGSRSNFPEIAEKGWSCRNRAWNGGQDDFLLLAASEGEG
jgi:hypothetical protein